MLLGGDEITVSLHPLFLELDLVPAATANLMTEAVANARVAVTRSDRNVDGRAGHAQAMKQSESGHDKLKGYEQLARDLTQKSKRLPPALAAQAREVSGALSKLFVMRSDEGDALASSDGDTVNIAHLETRAAALLRAAEATHE